MGDFTSDSLGRFHLQPDTSSGCVVNLAGGICADSGSFPRDQRFDRGTTRSLVSDVDRLNFYTYFTHEINDDLEFFSEAIFYRAEAERTREQTHNLTAQRFMISADAAHNPLGKMSSYVATVRLIPALETLKLTIRATVFLVGFVVLGMIGIGKRLHFTQQLKPMMKQTAFKLAHFKRR